MFIIRERCVETYSLGIVLDTLDGEGEGAAIVTNATFPRLNTTLLSLHCLPDLNASFHSVILNYVDKNIYFLLPSKFRAIYYDLRFSGDFGAELDGALRRDARVEGHAPLAGVLGRAASAAGAGREFALLASVRQRRSNVGTILMITDGDVDK